MNSLWWNAKIKIQTCMREKNKKKSKWYKAITFGTFIADAVDYFCEKLLHRYLAGS